MSVVPGPLPGFPADVDITIDLVGRLLAAQHPALAGRPRTLVAQGWDNVMVRVGEDLVARLPRRRLAADNARNEQRMLSAVGALLPLATPVPVRLGEPDTTLGYPYPWSIVPWLAGTVAAEATIDQAASAPRLGAFLAALHRPAPPDVADNPYRSGDVCQRAEVVATRLADVAPAWPEVDGDRLVAEVAAADSTWTAAPVWVHGDLHPRNLLIDEHGVLSAVLDFGDTHAGDPAVDLGGIWLLLDRVHHEAIRSHLDVDDETWRRGRAWGIHLAGALASHPADTDFARIARAALTRVIEDLDRTR